MGCTVAELDQRVSHAEYREWLEFFAIEPFGLQGQDMLTAQLVAAVLAAGGVKNVNPADYRQFDEARLSLPDDVDAAEQAMMMKLLRAAS